MPNLHRVTMILIQAEAAKLILKGLRGAKTLMGISHPNSDKMILILDKAVRQYRESRGDTRIAVEGTSLMLSELTKGLGYYTVLYGCTPHYAAVCSAVSSAKQLLEYQGGVVTHRNTSLSSGE